MIAIDDPHLPGLSVLNPEALRRITGSDTVSLVRFRYQAGKRAILQLDTGGGREARQGAAWFFRGDKARRLAERHGTGTYDPATGALFEEFPHDHRMPQIRGFLENYAELAPRLLGGRPAGQPRLMRYRPGLSCTFRCELQDGGTAYVKLIKDESPERISVMNHRMAALLSGGPASIAPVIGTVPEFSAISYRAARGRSLGVELAAGSVEPLLQSLDALRRFWRLPFTPMRYHSVEELRRRVAESTALVAVAVPECLKSVERVRTRIEQGTPRLGWRPIHADVKLEHLFLDGGRTTLIDTESVSLGPPDYDLAQLYGRLWQAELEGQLATPLVQDAADEVRRSAGAGFRWCLDVVALALAKFYAQRPSPMAESRISGILQRLE